MIDWTRRTARRWTLSISVVCLGLLACHRRATSVATVADTTSAMAPMIDSVSPDTVIIRDGAAAVLTLRGKGFASDSNTVRVGPVTLYGIRGTNGGTTLTIILPDRLPSGGGAPPMLWTSGTFDVVIHTMRGRSAVSQVTIRELR